MANALTGFWRKCELEVPPYLHPKDRLESNRIQQGVNCYADYVHAFDENRLSDKKLHLSLLPQPYQGNLENAEVIVLLKNPGFSPSDYIAEENPEYRQSIIETIRQERRSHMFLDPKWAWTGGFTWWESKLRKVTCIIAREKFKGNYSKALADLAKRIASLELVPYHSKSFSGSTQMASARAARRFAKEASSNPGRTIIVTRAVGDWDVGDGPNIITYQRGQTRGASLGPESRGGRAILSCYGLS